MRQIIAFAVVALVAGSYLARYADKTVVETPAPQAAAVQTAEQPMQVSAGQHKMELTSGRDGHFRVDARVDGRHIDFMVDTGASLVILRETDAAQVGLHPMPRDYTAIVSTANGPGNISPGPLARGKPARSPSIGPAVGGRLPVAPRVAARSCHAATCRDGRTHDVAACRQGVRRR